ncbi:hypothetical protein ABM34_07700 [Companilactobacillus ginsenosidimutans]|uniref:Uncharacterized protein n=2 Tax=Companilactobacillus ginsenosidimutans TaxID=1007676 RepID=A0A0H4QL46_9LACO|nr:hypothetical protein ABM34_07700 [Companilactobacillus ginsenosidimutans]
MIGTADAHGYRQGMESGNCDGSGQVYNQGGHHRGEGFGAGYGNKNASNQNFNTQVSNNQAVMMNQTNNSVESSNVNSTFTPLQGPCLNIGNPMNRNNVQKNAFSYNCIRMNNLLYPN